ncbi:hypothetical protein D3C86_1548710 [compost metagenome]
MRPGQAAFGVEQLLGEAHDEDAPQRGQGDAIQPEGHGAARPQVLEAVTAHAEDEYQHAGGGQHVPEIGLVAQGDEDEQVVQQQRQDHAVDQAEADVFVAGLLLEVAELPDGQREGVAGGVEAAEVQGQGFCAQLGQFEQHASIGVVAALGVGHRGAGCARVPAALAVG